ncbi:eukaryotic translation initiation factor 5B isoform X1 [Tachypleus tridentatus]|uniref:eukaryotic translation initiation factor 5B isoform X1 n=1 Tax=Tachypleus tridentatus TaxID=6853 RepID=UPI003FCFCFEB
MGKDKKSKKGKQEEDIGKVVGEDDTSKLKNDLEPESRNSKVSTKKIKKGKHKKDDDWKEDVAKEIESMTLEEKEVNEAGKYPKLKEDENQQGQDLKDKQKKRKKEKKGKVDIGEAEYSDRSNVVIEDDKTGKKGKDNEDKPKSKSGRLKGNKILDSDEDEQILNQSKGLKLQSVYQLLEEETMDLDVSIDNEEEQKMSDKFEENMEDLEEDKTKKEEKGGKKSKKKERKKKQDDEEVDKIIEELALEIEGKVPPQNEIPHRDDQLEAEGQVKVESGAEKLSKKKKKKGAAETEDIEKEDKLDQSEIQEKVHTVKTAAQKKKEKKEREKQKKQSQKMQTIKNKVVETPSTEDKEETLLPLEEKKAVVEDEIPKDVDEEKDEEGDGKKKKKKKGEEDKKDKKRPGKKQIAAMQEAMKKLKEEEERLRLEEEAKQRAAEEAECLRLEKLRLEQERKEKKKQKEKEKRERLKAEGKLLSKAQKQARARMEATLEVLRQQGVEVPQIGEKRERAPRLGDRKRFPKKKSEEEISTESQHENAEEPSKEPAKIEVAIVGHKEDIDGDLADKIPVDGKVVKESDATVAEEVKEAWDEESSGEEEEDELEVNDVQATADEKVAVKDESEDENEEEEEDEDEESSDDEENTGEESDSSEESEADRHKNEAKIKERALIRIQKRREIAEKNRTIEKLRSPVVCVLGHVDTGKTKILDKIRRTHVQDGEAGGITQQIGATMVPVEAIKEQCKMVKNFNSNDLKLPGLLIIDTPGHESFSNLRSRGSSLCDIAILVVDIMHGLEPQTIESINLLKQKKTPFVIALNKVDRLYEWKSNRNKDIQDVIKSQARNTKLEFEERTREVIAQIAEQGLNASLYYENKDTRTFISMVPTSAISGDGMGNVIGLIVELTQTIMAKRLAFSEELQATVLEVKAIPGLGTTIDTVLVNGRLREGDTIILAGHEGPLVTQIRSLLMPQPLKELRVKNIYQEFKEVEGAQGVKIAGKDLDKAIAGLQLLVAHHTDEIDILKEEVNSSLREVMSSFKLAERGVYVQASTLGSLEALLEFLRASKIPYSGIRIGPVVKKDVMKASIMLEHDSQYAVILAFDVKIERDAQELSESLGVKIFQADIIYHLFDKFTAYREELKQKKREEFRQVAVFPCKLRILPQFIFNSRDPIVIGVSIESGVLKEGTPLCVPSRDFLDVGTVTTIEVNHKPVENARKGQEVCIKIEPLSGESPKMYGRHFEHTDLLVSKISRQSIDACKDYFREDLLKSDWQLMVELKKLFQIM